MVPEGTKDPMDVTRIILRLVDGGDFLEVHQAWARNIIVGFAPLKPAEFVVVYLQQMAGQIQT